MKNVKTHKVPPTLEILNQKLDFEIKRLVQTREDGIASYVSKKAILNGTSRLVFKNEKGAKIFLSYRLDDGGTLRFAREQRFTDPSFNQKQISATSIGRSSGDIKA
jgi:hypothetical protein